MGRTVVLTRARDGADELAGRLRAEGIEVVECPLIRIEPLDGPPVELSGYDWLVLTSARAVQCLEPRLPSWEGLPSVAVIGPGTAEALRSRGVEPALVAGRSTQEGLMAELRPLLAAHGHPSRILFAGAEAHGICSRVSSRPISSRSDPDRGRAARGVSRGGSGRAGLGIGGACVRGAGARPSLRVDRSCDVRGGEAPWPASGGRGCEPGRLTASPPLSSWPCRSSPDGRGLRHRETGDGRRHRLRCRIRVRRRSRRGCTGPDVVFSASRARACRSLAARLIRGSLAGAAVR